jgi:DNA-directed RNA polymerase specialized sigma24 family protein
MPPAALSNARLEDYRGLIRRTSQMFAERAGMEREDFEQELWIKVWRAREMYDPRRSKLNEQRYVYSLMFNRVKDMLRYPRKRELLIGDIAPESETADGASPYA